MSSNESKLRLVKFPVRVRLNFAERRSSNFVALDYCPDHQLRQLETISKLVVGTAEERDREYAAAIVDNLFKDSHTHMQMLLMAMARRRVGRVLMLLDTLDKIEDKVYSQENIDFTRDSYVLLQMIKTLKSDIDQSLLLLDRVIGSSDNRDGRKTSTSLFVQTIQQTNIVNVDQSTVLTPEMRSRVRTLFQTLEPYIEQAIQGIEVEVDEDETRSK